jgi:hypothetical protein
VGIVAGQAVDAVDRLAPREAERHREAAHGDDVLNADIAEATRQGPDVPIGVGLVRVTSQAGRRVRTAGPRLGGAAGGLGVASAAGGVRRRSGHDAGDGEGSARQDDDGHGSDEVAHGIVLRFRT